MNRVFCDDAGLHSCGIRVFPFERSTFMNACKRIAAAMLSVVLSLSLLAGCAKTTADGRMVLAVSVGSRVTTLEKCMTLIFLHLKLE